MTRVGAAAEPMLQIRRLPPLSRSSILWVVALGAGTIAALVLAANAGVKGVAAVPDVLRAAIATVAFFGVCGYAAALRWTPPALYPVRALLVLPVGAVAGPMALTLLGFALVPFPVSLPLTLTAFAVWGIAEHRKRTPQPAGGVAWPQLAVIAVAVLIAAVALIPTFRSGVATVTGMGSDAHVVAGSATVLQHTRPGGTDTALPVDTVPWQWYSKFPIFYALAAVSSLAGLAAWQALMTAAAILFALTAIGFYLLARCFFRTGAAAATAAMAIAVLDQMVFHLAEHPYWNQLWGTFTVPFSIVAGQIWLQRRERQAALLFLSFFLLGLFAYPLMAPFPLGAVFFTWLFDRIARKRRGEPVEPLRPPRWSRRAWAAVPLLLLLFVMIVAVVLKFVEFIRLLDDTSALHDWQGDLFNYPPVNQFFGLAHQLPAETLLVAGVVAIAAVGLWRAPRPAGIALIPVLAGAGAMALLFHDLRYGQYVYFKILAFTGPLVLVACVAGLERLRAAGAVAIAVLLVSGLLLARDELGNSFDQLTPETIQLQDWARALPPGASIRLDTPPNEQIWQEYMLHDRPTGSRVPLIQYPHVQFTQGADYVLDETLTPPPDDRAANRPVFRNAAYRLWKLRPGDGPDTTSRAQSNAGAPPGSLGGH